MMTMQDAKTQQTIHDYYGSLALIPNEPKTVVIKTFFLIRYNFNTFDGTNKTYAMGLEYGSTDLFMLPLIDLVLLLLTSQLFLYGRWPFSTEEVNFGRCKWRKQRRGLYVICNLFSTILSMSHFRHLKCSQYDGDQLIMTQFPLNFVSQWIMICTS